MSYKGKIISILFAVCVLLSAAAKGQVTAPGANASDKTAYPVFRKMTIFLFFV